ncbi:predicted protein [Nematostella vectensis]|uniref:G-protein coupled receptors family 1 profile domain-containing protein n=1 Tax=Nematostella vectensis TaxID=45351 RepID=A7S4X4_NEMVE|nr:predicted protein [Nematostella vectensis]|eukprot:XP_001633335.1 predicted protein [Nematostella vectensis]
MNVTVNASAIFALQLKGEKVIALLFYAVLMLTDVVGNGLIIAAFSYNPRLRCVTNILVIGLSAADILVGAISIPCWMSITLRQFDHAPLDQYVYQFYITSDIFIGTASILHLTCIAMERCHAVLQPFNHRLISRRVFYVIVTCVWVFSAGIALLQPFQKDTWEHVYTLMTTIICFFIPTTIILVSYICIFKRSRGGRHLCRHRNTQAVMAQELRLSITVCLITVLFVLSWLPLFSFSMVATYNPRMLPGATACRRIIAFVKWMHYSSSALNPFLYSYRNAELGKTIKAMLSRIFLGTPSPLVAKTRPGTSSSFSFRSRSLNFGRKTSTNSSHKSSQHSTKSQGSPKRHKEDQNNNNDGSYPDRTFV